MAGNDGLLIFPVVGLIAIGTYALTGASFEHPPELSVESAKLQLLNRSANRAKK